MSMCRRVALTALILSSSTIVACRPSESDAGEPEAPAPAAVSTPTPATATPRTTPRRRPAPKEDVVVDETVRAKEAIEQFYGLLQKRQVRLARGMLLEPSEARRVEALAANLGWTAELMESNRLRIDVLEVRVQGNWAVAATRVNSVSSGVKERDEFLYLSDGEWRVAPEAVRADREIRTLIDDDFKALFNWYRNERSAVKDDAAVTPPVTPAVRSTPTGDTAPTSDTSSIPLTRRDVLDGAASLLIPDAFTTMEPEMLRTKYPGNDRPTLVFTNETGSINVALNHTTSEVTVGELPMVKRAMDQQFSRLDPAPMDYDSTVAMIGETTAVRFNFRSKATDTEIHNLMAAVLVNGRLLLASVNLTVEHEDAWMPVAQRIIESIRVD